MGTRRLVLLDGKELVVLGLCKFSFDRNRTETHKPHENEIPKFRKPGISVISQVSAR